MAGPLTGGSARRLEGWRAAPEADRLVLLEVVGSRGVNLAFAGIILALVGTLVHIAVVGSTAVLLCHEAISLHVANPWWALLLSKPRPGDLPRLDAALPAMRVVLAEQAERAGLQLLLPEDAGTVPWCNWCTPSEQFALRDSAGSVDVPLGPSDAASNASLTLDLVLGMDTNVSIACILMVLPRILVVLRERSFEPSKNGEGGPLWCLLEEDAAATDPRCGPCSDPAALRAEVLAADGDNATMLRDLVSGQVFPAEEYGRLWPRCVTLQMLAFMDACGGADGGNRSSCFEDPDYDTQLSRRLVQGSPEPPGVPIADITTGNINGDLIRNLVKQAGGNASSPVSAHLVKIRESLGGRTGNELFDALAGNCSVELPSILHLVAQPTGAMRARGSLAEEVSTAGVCWVLYTWFFLKESACYSMLSNASQAFVTDDGDAEGEDALAISMEAVLVLLDSLLLAVFGVARAEEASKVPQGAEVLSMFQTLRDWDSLPDLDQFSGLFPSAFPGVEDKGAKVAACATRLEESRQQLGEFVTFFDGLDECLAPADQQRLSSVFEVAGFFFVAVVFLAQLTSFALGTRTPYSLAMMALTVGMLCVLNVSRLMNGQLETGPREVLREIFFARLDEVPGSSVGSDLLIGLGLGLFYLQHVLVLRAIAQPPEAEPTRVPRGLRGYACRGGTVVHIAVLVMYAALRGVVVPVVLKSSMGLVPFVGWITAGRICALSFVTSFPRCNSSDVDEELGVWPFVGMVITSVADATLLLLAERESRLCSERLRRRPFTAARGAQLLFSLKTLLTRLVVAATLFSGVLYTSMIDVRVGYIGFIDLEPEGTAFEGVSLRYTGVHMWSFAFTFMLLVYTCGWLMLLLPLESVLGRAIMSCAAEELSIRMRFVARESSALDRTSMGKLCRADDRTFCLEAQFLRAMLTNSCYHVEAQGGRATFLPHDFKQLGYIDCRATDTHVWVVARGASLFVAFRGTTSTRNARTDLRMDLTTLKWSPPPEALEAGEAPCAASRRAEAVLRQFQANNSRVRVHAGFLHAFRSVQDELTSIVTSHFASQPSAPHVVVTGHSLGGSLATLCGVFLGSALPKSIVEVSTFGSPRPGNHSFAKFFRQQVASGVRFAMMGDPIVKTPLRVPCSRHHGYTHVGTEVLLRPNGDLILDPSVVERALLHSWKWGGGAEHKVQNYLLALLSFSLVAAGEGFRPVLWPNLRERASRSQGLSSSLLAYFSAASEHSAHSEHQQQSEPDNETEDDEDEGGGVQLELA